ncbi:MAG: glycosyltransferase, partial [Candidatus Hydrogenedentota bacterium]
MKILHFLRKDILGGTEKSVINIASGLKARGLDVSVAILEGKADVSRILKEKDIKCYLFDTCYNISDITLFFKIRDLFKNNSFDIVTFYGLKLNLISRILRKTGCRIPVHLGGLRSIYPSDSASDLHILIDKITFRFSNGYISNSKKAVEFLTAKGFPKEKMFYIPNGIERISIEIKGSRNDFYKKLGINVNDNDTVLISVANLREVKNHLFMFEVFKGLLKEFDNVKLILVGDGPLREVLKEKVKEITCEEKIFFLGKQLDVFEFLVHSDILILTSKWEGLPTSIMEASAVGLPVVSTNVGGISELVIDKKTGFLLEQGDLNGFVERIKYLIQNKEIR